MTEQLDNRAVGDKENVSTDGDLMDALQRNSMHALGVLYRRYSVTVQKAILRAMPTIVSEDKEELVQDVFLSLSQLAGGYDTSRPLKPWLYGVAFKKAQNFKKKTRHRAGLLHRHQEVLPTSLHEPLPTTSLEAKEQVGRLFLLLPKSQLEVMVLHAVEGFTGEEIADILEIEVNTVWSRIHRARARIMASVKSDDAARRADEPL